MTTSLPATAARSRVVVGRSDPRDLDGDFGHRHEVSVRFRDTDAMGHVNNAVYLTFAEAGRLAWWADVTGEPIQREEDRSDGLILAEAEVAFRSPIHFGETVTVETRATRLGRTSIDVEHRMTAASVGEAPRVVATEAPRLVATVRSVIVRYDYRTARPVAWPSALIARIEAFEGRSLRG